MERAVQLQDVTCGLCRRCAVYPPIQDLVAVVISRSSTYSQKAGCAIGNAVNSQKPRRSSAKKSADAATQHRTSKPFLFFKSTRRGETILSRNAPRYHWFVLNRRIPALGKMGYRLGATASSSTRRSTSFLCSPCSSFQAATLLVTPKSRHNSLMNLSSSTSEGGFSLSPKALPPPPEADIPLQTPSRVAQCREASGCARPLLP